MQHENQHRASAPAVDSRARIGTSGDRSNPCRLVCAIAAPVHPRRPRRSSAPVQSSRPRSAGGAAVVPGRPCAVTRAARSRPAAPLQRRHVESPVSRITARVVRRADRRAGTGTTAAAARTTTEEVPAGSRRAAAGGTGRPVPPTGRRAATVGASNSVRTASSTPSTSRTRQISRTASSECPPRSKKLSSTPTDSRPRTCANAAHRSSSRAVTGPGRCPPRREIGGGQRLAVQFPVRCQRQRGQNHHGRRDHVLRQPPAHEGQQSAGSDSVTT